MTTHTTKAKRIAYLEALAMKQGRMLEAMTVVFGEHIDKASKGKIKNLIDAAKMIPNAQQERRRQREEKIERNVLAQQKK